AQSFLDCFAADEPDVEVILAANRREIGCGVRLVDAQRLRHALGSAIVTELHVGRHRPTTSKTGWRQRPSTLFEARRSWPNRGLASRTIHEPKPLPRARSIHSTSLW